MGQLRSSQDDPTAVFRRAGFDPLGLDHQWTGLRSIGGHGASGEVIHSLTLTHGDPYNEALPLVRVETVLPRPVQGDLTADRAIERWSLVRRLVGAFWRSTHVLDPEIRGAAFAPGAMAGDPTAPWDQVTIRVDDVAVDLRVLEHEMTWVGVAERPDVLIGIEARLWPADRTGLRTVSNASLTAYEEGSRDLKNRRSSNG